ncbi:tRNA (adenine(58)-N(1))-methyltransferase non-catalytic subunit TRM6-like [Haemaphysalis longicornis]
MNTIKEGDFVVLRGLDNARLVQVDRKKEGPSNEKLSRVDDGPWVCCEIFKPPVFFGKKKINIHSAIGESFGSVFELCNMNLRKITAEEHKKGVRNARFLAVTIVRTLVENSATFRDKAEYSQRNYLHKKHKYQPHLTLERPTACLLAKVYYSQSPLKIG